MAVSNQIAQSVQFLKTDIWRIRTSKLSTQKSFWIRQLRIILLAIHGFGEDKCQLRASALTFFSLLSVAYCAMYNLTQGRYVAPFVILTLQGLTLELKEGNNGRVHHGTTIQAGVFTIHL